MKQVGELVDKNRGRPSQQQTMASRRWTEREHRKLSRLAGLMSANYGRLFDARVATDEQYDAWRSVWIRALDGKEEELLADVFTECFKRYPVPFRVADLEAVYADMRRANKAEETAQVPKARKRTEDEISNGLAEIRKMRAAAGI